MTDTKEDRIRKRAHKIWEDAGQPEGDHESHWRQAVSEVEAEDAKAVKPRASKADAAAPAKKTAAKPAAAKTAPAKPTASAPAKKPAVRKAKEAPVP